MDITGNALGGFHIAMAAILVVPFARFAPASRFTLSCSFIAGEAPSRITYAAASGFAALSDSGFTYPGPIIAYVAIKLIMAFVFTSALYCLAFSPFALSMIAVFIFIARIGCLSSDIFTLAKLRNRVRPTLPVIAYKVVIAGIRSFSVDLFTNSTLSGVQSALSML